jgi:peptidyl-prolyl cis-trans isomerase A (cyclophilin A)
MRTYLSLFALGLAALVLTAYIPSGQAAAREPGLYATMTTSLGTIVLKLYEQESPITVKNFVDLALGRKAWLDPKTGQMVTRPLYNGLTFHRVIPGFMIQGGDPLGNGTGGTRAIKDEFHPSLKFNTSGRLAMANAGPNTGSCQFFITETPTTHLNGLHTIFGQVVEGQNVVSKIARTPRDSNDMPRTPVVIQSITFQREGPGPTDDVLAPPAPKK